MAHVNPGSGWCLASIRNRATRTSGLADEYKAGLPVYHSFLARLHTGIRLTTSRHPGTFSWLHRAGNLTFSEVCPRPMQPTVLVVDDDMTIRDTLGTILRHEGFAIEQA